MAYIPSVSARVAASYCAPLWNLWQAKAKDSVVLALLHDE